MLFWLLVIILSYLFFSFSFLADKLVLSGPPNPKLYTFYVSVLGILVVFFIPFIGFGLPETSSIIWIVLDAFAYVLGLYSLFLVLANFEVSRVMTMIGALQPIFILILTGIFWGAQLITKVNLLAFILLLLGSIVISLERKFNMSGKYALIIAFCALMFSLDYVFSKLVFSSQPFLQGLIWMRISSFLLVLVFLFDKNLRYQIFSKKPALSKKTGMLFLFGQMSGGVAGVLQSLAIALVPVSFLAIINSLRGVQYIFLFLITLFLSHYFPHILKEDVSKKIIIQKTIAIILIVGGLALLIQS